MFTNNIAFKVIYLPKNQGHGEARRISIDNCSNELIALMDADDISYPNRFLLQLHKFNTDAETDICGGQITEFVGTEDNIVGIRQVQCEDKAIKEDLKKRCPMNQVTVMFKKSAYSEAGGYIDWYCEEDYYLWTRMVQKGCKFANIDESIVNVRTGMDMSARRGGWRYYRSEKDMQKYLFSNGLISLPRYLKNVLVRFGGEVILNDKLRQKAFYFLRTHESNEIPKSESCSKSEFDLHTKENFSVAMCVYEKDNPEWFDRAIGSISLEQCVSPNEIVLVVDGPIPSEIQDVIDKYVGVFGKQE